MPSRGTLLDPPTLIHWHYQMTLQPSDPDFANLTTIIESGFPQFHLELPPTFQKYYQFHEHLNTVDGVILYKDLVVIPPSL